MKKFAKIMSSALCAILCVIVLAGCGGKGQLDTEASISKKGLATSTTEDLETFLDGKKDVETGEPTLSTEGLASYKMTYKFKDGDEEMVLNAIVVLDLENEKIEGLALKCTEKVEEGNSTITMYIKDDIMYMALDTNVYGQKVSLKYKTSMADDNAEATLAENEGDLDYTEDVDYTGSFDGILSLLDSIDISALLEQIINISTMYEGNENVKITKYTNGDVTRYGVEFSNADSTSTTKLYFEITGNNLTGYELAQTDVEDGVTYESYSAITKFDGKISYPKFKDYVDLDEALGDLEA